jgi:hypothetical protein
MSNQKKIRIEQTLVKLSHGVGILGNHARVELHDYVRGLEEALAASPNRVTAREFEEARRVIIAACQTAVGKPVTACSDDTQRINHLEGMLDAGKYSRQCILRMSTTGRGFRLHETRRLGAFDTVRQAIDEVMEHGVTDSQPTPGT